MDSLFLFISAFLILCVAINMIIWSFNLIGYVNFMNEIASKMGIRTDYTFLVEKRSANRIISFAIVTAVVAIICGVVAWILHPSFHAHDPGVVFDLAGKGFPWLSIYAFSLVVYFLSSLIIGWVMSWNIFKHLRYKMPSISKIMIVLPILSTILGGIAQYGLVGREGETLGEAYLTKSYKSVEGEVRSVKGLGGFRTFSIDNLNMRFSRFINPDTFYNSKRTGGQVEKGQFVKVSYWTDPESKNNVILRMEVLPGKGTHGESTKANVSKTTSSHKLSGKPEKKITRKTVENTPAAVGKPEEEKDKTNGAGLETKEARPPVQRTLRQEIVAYVLSPGFGGFTALLVFGFCALHLGLRWSSEKEFWLLFIACPTAAFILRFVFFYSFPTTDSPLLFDPLDSGFSWMYVYHNIAWTFLIVGCINGLALFIIRPTQDNHWRGLVGGLLMIFAFAAGPVVGAISLYKAYTNWSTVESVYRNKQFQVLSGPVTDYKPRRSFRSDETFQLKGTTFSYREWKNPGAFGQTQLTGNLLREGTQVKIWSYWDPNSEQNLILRLETLNGSNENSGQTK